MSFVKETESFVDNGDLLQAFERLRTALECHEIVSQRAAMEWLDLQDCLMFALLEPEGCNSNPWGCRVKATVAMRTRSWRRAGELAGHLAAGEHGDKHLMFALTTRVKASLSSKPDASPLHTAVPDAMQYWTLAQAAKRPDRLRTAMLRVFLACGNPDHLQTMLQMRDELAAVSPSAAKVLSSHCETLKLLKSIDDKPE